MNTLGIVLLVWLHPALGADYTCRYLAAELEDICYTDAGVWPYPDAKDLCTDLGASLPVPTNKPENQFFKREAKGDYWLGISDNEREGFWKEDVVNGAVLSWFNWNLNKQAGGRAENCAFALKSDGTWKDASCSSVKKRAICLKKNLPVCEQAVTPCHHVCTATHQGYTCSCHTGYDLSDVGDFSYRCIDIDECAAVPSPCDELCKNIAGSYSCETCQTGLVWSDVTRRCIDVNECAQSTSPCDHVCQNTKGSYSCSCHTGFSLAGDNRSCADLDECVQSTSPCDQSCQNTNGSYICGCHPGFSLARNNHSCIGCPPGTHGAACTGECHCASINICDAATGNCDGDCAPGWQGPQCQQRNCQYKEYCGIHTCNEYNSTYNCSCKTGYENTDPHTCVDIDECALNIDTCDIHVCNNTDGAYNCECKENYTNIRPTLCAEIIIDPDDFESKLSFFPEPIPLKVFVGGISSIVVIFIAVNLTLLARTIASALYRFITTKPVRSMWDSDTTITTTNSTSFSVIAERLTLWMQPRTRRSTDESNEERKHNRIVSWIRSNPRRSIHEIHVDKKHEECQVEELKPKEASEVKEKGPMSFFRRLSGRSSKTGLLSRTKSGETVMTDYKSVASWESDGSAGSRPGSRLGSRSGSRPGSISSDSTQTTERRSRVPASRRTTVESFKSITTAISSKVSKETLKPSKSETLKPSKSETLKPSKSVSFHSSY